MNEKNKILIPKTDNYTNNRGRKNPVPQRPPQKSTTSQKKG